MAKKRKVLEVIEDIDTSIVAIETDRPKCFNSKKPYCKRELCEDYYDSCQDSDSDELF